MVRQWQVLDLSSFEGELHSRRGSLEVLDSRGVGTVVPVSDLAVVLVGLKVALNASVLHRLCSADVAVLFCDWRGIPEGAVYSWSAHGRVGARHRAQAALSEPRRKNAWGRIVKAKVLGQAAVLEERDFGGFRELRELAKLVRSGDPENIEARAARVYWQHSLCGEVSREPGGGARHGWNSCLDYGYSVLRGFVVKAVLSAGLSGSLGVFHRGRGNTFALADDLIEPFRPCVDRVVFGLGVDASPEDREVKRILVAAATQTFDSRGYGIPAVAEEFAQHFGQYVEGERERLIPPVWEGPVYSDG